MLTMLFMSCSAARSEAVYAQAMPSAPPAAQTPSAAAARDRSYAPPGTPNSVVPATGMTARLEPIRVSSQTRVYKQFRAAGAPVVHLSERLAPSARYVVKAGTPAEIAFTERVVKWNDTVVERHVVGRQVLRKASPALVLAGLSHAVAASVLTLVATAYTALSAGSSSTASGRRALRGVVAVDPHLIPLGTRLYIPGYGRAVAGDTGGAIYGHRIDLCMNSQREALSFGRQTIKVYVLGR
jgi:3D (Asp-Asp-Asp) domain-containing protein